MPVAETHTEEIQNEFEHYSREADDLLAAIASEERQPNFSETMWFQSKLNWEPDRARQEMRRTQRRIRLQLQAGTPDTRKAAKSQCTRAANVLESEGPKLQDTIDKATAKLKSLETSASLAAKRCDEIDKAVIDLRDNLPDHVIERHNFESRALADTVRRPLLDAKTRLRQLEVLTDPSRFQSPKDYIDSVRSQPGAVTETPTRGYTKLELSPEFPAIVEGWRKERDALAPKVEAMQADYDAKKTELDKMLDYYSEPQNTAK